jgi:chaperonin cofactor prefoldin
MALHDEDALKLARRLWSLLAKKAALEKARQRLSNDPHEGLAEKITLLDRQMAKLDAQVQELSAAPNTKT